MYALLFCSPVGLPRFGFRIAAAIHRQATNTAKKALLEWLPAGRRMGSRTNSAKFSNHSSRGNTERGYIVTPPPISPMNNKAGVYRKPQIWRHVWGGGASFESAKTSAIRAGIRSRSTHRLQSVRCFPLNFSWFQQLSAFF